MTRAHDLALLRELVTAHGIAGAEHVVQELSPQDSQLQVRVSRARLDSYREAARRAGVSVSEWARGVLDAAAAPPVPSRTRRRK